MKRVVDIGDLGTVFVENTPPPLVKLRPAKTKIGPFGSAHASTPNVPALVSPEVPGDGPREIAAHSPWPWLAGALGLAAFTCGLGWVVCHARCGDCR